MCLTDAKGDPPGVHRPLAEYSLSFQVYYQSSSVIREQFTLLVYLFSTVGIPTTSHFSADPEGLPGMQL